MSIERQREFDQVKQEKDKRGAWFIIVGAFFVIVGAWGVSVYLGLIMTGVLFAVVGFLFLHFSEELAMKDFKNDHE